MIDNDGTCGGGLSSRIEGALEGSKGIRDVFVEITNLTRRFSDELGLIVWKMGQGLRSFGVLNLCRKSSVVFHLFELLKWGKLTSLRA